jgi:AraC family transcriptional regulator
MVQKLDSGSFFGQTQERWTVAGIIVLESSYHIDHAVPPHEHSAAFFDLVLEGGCSEVVGTHVRDRDRSTLAFHPAGEVHSSRWHGVAPRCFHIEIPAALLSRATEYASIPDHPVHAAGEVTSLLALRLYREFRQRDEISPLVIEALALELLAESARRTYSKPDRLEPRWLNAVRDLLEARFTDHLTLHGVAESVGVHPAHLARVFRRFHGCTVGDYVRRLRIEYACDRLLTTDAPLAEIALAAGFSDQSHFSNTFKRQRGLSPANFKKSFDPRKADSTECRHRARS